MVLRGILICPHCGRPHELTTKVCVATGKSLERDLHRPYHEKRHPLVGTVLDSRYRILRLIGVGGMGEVLEAETIALRRLFVVKIVRAGVVSDESIERLRREAELVAAVQHPNICAVFDFGTMEDGRPYVVLERLFGEPLSKTIASGTKAALGWVVDIFAQVLSGLHAAHGADIVHRDVKPQNVFLVDRLGCAPLAKILDFGFAKDVATVKRGRTLTAPGKALGTPGYSAPEQIVAEVVDRRADIFSVGVMLQEVLTGTNPFKRATAIDTQSAILRDEPATISELRPDLPSALHKVVERALAKNRDDRWQTALQMQQALVKCIR
ncbi:MAG TPA: serine/threonine-protein kinase [Labilithrix sp.]